MEKILRSINLYEPILLVGSTGNGKTFLIQELARLCHKKLYIFNLNQETDASDLLGGYQPIHLNSIAINIMNKFAKLFPKTFSTKKNLNYINNIKELYDNKQYKLLNLSLLQIIANVKKILNTNNHQITKQKEENIEKKRKIKHQENHNSPNIKLWNQWYDLYNDIISFQRQIKAKKESKATFAFTFREGILIDCIKNGYWILLDEINLATTETIQRLAGLLEEKNNIRFNLSERGDNNDIKIHPDFRIIACMNPGGRIGKRQLLSSIRSRFTEFYYDDIINENDLNMIVCNYLKLTQDNINDNLMDKINNIVQYYLKLLKLSKTILFKGDLIHPNYSLRTFCRALEF